MEHISVWIVNRKYSIAMLSVIACMCILSASCTNKPSNTTSKSSAESVVTSNDTSDISASVSATTILLDDVIPSDYIITTNVPDGDYSGRVYQNQLFLNTGGKRYLVVGEIRGENDDECEYDRIGTYSKTYGRTLYTDDDLKKMKVGEHQQQ